MEVSRKEAEAANLITMIEEYALYTTLAPGTTTYRERQLHSSIDLCFVTAGLVERVIRSEVEEELDHDSDHLPISTILDVAAPNASTAPRVGCTNLKERIVAISRSE